MANKAISELPQAQNVNNQDLFVLEQSGIAKKLTAETFITEQGIIDALAEALDGHGGIQSVTLSSVSGRIRTYRITFSDGSATTFQVYDGTSIDRISRTSSSGLDDVYTIFLSDGTTTFFTVHNGADGTVSEAMLNDALKGKAPAITETTESSAIANFADGADDMVMHNVVAEINPVQSGSGDPSPSNIRPITGHTEVNVTRTGANVWDEVWEQGGVNPSNGTNYADTSPRIRSKNYIPVVPNTQYYFTLPNTVKVTAFYDTNKQFISGSWNSTLTFTTPANAHYMRFATNDNYGTSYNNDISINYPATDTQYHPYQGGNTVTVDWTTEAGTVYGGTIDVATGLLTVDRATVELDTSWFWYIGNTQPTGMTVATTTVFPIHIASNKDISSHYKHINTPYIVAMTLNSFFLSDTGTSAFFCFKNESGGTAQEFKDYITAQKNAGTPIQVCYKLATPQTYLLTPQQLMTLLGTNNVWTDIANVSVTYPADTKLYIEKLTIPSEDDLVANQAITSGQYFMIGNSLYLALANIASGAQITIGTNAQRVSLADALNTINA